MDLIVNIDAKYKKWMTLIGGFIIHVTLGLYYTFGNINPYLTSYLRDYTESSEVRYSKSIWIQSVVASSQCVAAIFSGVLTVKGVSPRLITLLGCLCMSASILLTAITCKHSLTLVTITYGVGNGFGNGLAYVSPMSLAMKWFPERKGEANAAVLFGFGLGGLVFTEIQSLYINPDNYPPDEPYSSQFPNEKYFSKLHPDLLARVPKSFLVVGLVVLVMQLIGCLLIFEPPKEEHKDLATSVNNASRDKIVDLIEEDSFSTDIVSQEHQPVTNVVKNDLNSLGVDKNSAESGIELKKVLRIPAFYMLWFCFAFTLSVPTMISSYYKTFGETFVKSDKFLSLVGSISSLFNALGRPFWGVFFDKAPFKVVMLTLNTALIFFCMTLYITQAIESETMFMIWICGIYCTFCGVYVVMPTITAKCFGQKYFTMTYGVMYTCGFVSSLSSAFLGELINSSIGWFGLFSTISGFSFLSWLIIMFFYVKSSNGEDI